MSQKNMAGKRRGQLVDHINQQSDCQGGWSHNAAPLKDALMGTHHETHDPPGTNQMICLTKSSKNSNFFNFKINHLKVK